MDKVELKGRKFRRQHSTGPYILDFYCPIEHLAIEVDGSVHDDPARHAYDEKRQRYLEHLGIRVLRLSNEYVLDQTDAALETIALHFTR